MRVKRRQIKYFYLQYSSGHQVVRAVLGNGCYNNSDCDANGGHECKNDYVRSVDYFRRIRTMQF